MNYPPYKIITENLVLRCWHPRDAALLKAAIDANLDHLRPWMPWALNEPSSLSQKVELLREFRSNFDSSSDFTYGVFSPNESLVIGGCGLHKRAGPHALEIGYWIARDYCGRGLATELAAALTQVAFSVNAIDRVEILHATDNVPSRRIPEKLGFVNEGVRRRRDFSFDHQVRDLAAWAIYKQDYQAPAIRAALRCFGADDLEIQCDD